MRRRRAAPPREAMSSRKGSPAGQQRLVLTTERTSPWRIRLWDVSKSRRRLSQSAFGSGRVACGAASSTVWSPTVGYRIGIGAICSARRDAEGARIDTLLATTRSDGVADGFIAVPQVP